MKKFWRALSLAAGLLLASVASPSEAAWQSQGSLGSVSEKVADTDIALTTTAGVEVGNVAVVMVVIDNITTATSATQAISTNDIRVRDCSNNNWQRVAERLNGASGLGDSIQVAMFVTRATVLMASGCAITATLNGVATAKAMVAHEFTIPSNSDYEITAVTTQSLDETGNPPGYSLTGLTSEAHLFLHTQGIEFPNTGTYTESTGYTSFTAVGTSGGVDGTNVALRGGFKIAVSTDETIDTNWSNAADQMQIFAALTEIAGAAQGGGGLPPGGGVGQVLKKLTSADFNVGWSTDLTTTTGQGTATVEVQCANNVNITSTLQAAIDTDKIVLVSNGECEIRSPGIQLGAGTVMIGAGAGRADHPATSTTKFLVRDDLTPGLCGFSGPAGQYTAGMYLSSFGVTGSNATGKAFCFEGYGNASHMNNLRLRNLETALQFYDSASDQAVIWYGSVEDIYVDLIRGCAIDINGGILTGGRGAVMGRFAGMDIQSIGSDANDGQFCIQNVQEGSALILEGFIWNVNEAYTGASIKPQAIRIRNWPFANLTVIGGKPLLSATQDFINTDRDDGHYTIMGVHLQTNPANPTWCDKLIEAPSASADVPCQKGSTIFSSSMINGQVQ